MAAPSPAIALLSMSACLLALTGCATHADLQPPEQEAELTETLQGRSIAPATAAEREAIHNQDLLTQAAFWAEAYELNPGDREAAFELSSVLRQLGSTQRAAEVSRQALALYPDDQDLLSAYGMALTADGRGAQAVEYLMRAMNAGTPDWRLVNTLGVALEQSGRPDQARARFMEALGMQPGEPAIMNNLALSHLLAGEPERAEAVLRQAMQNISAGPEVRQNLAMALALQGRFDEAREIALIDSTPEMAEANLDYIRNLMSSPRSWDQLRRSEALGG